MPYHWKDPMPSILCKEPRFNTILCGLYYWIWRMDLILYHVQTDLFLSSAWDPTIGGGTLPSITGFQNPTSEFWLQIYCLSVGFWQCWYWYDHWINTTFLDLRNCHPKHWTSQRLVLNHVQWDPLAIRSQTCRPWKNNFHKMALQ